MATDAADWTTLCSAVQDILESVSGIGKVERRPGGTALWLEKARPLMAYWEIDVLRVAERGAQLGPAAFEAVTFQVEGWMPWSYDNPDTAATWRPLVGAVRNRLRRFPTLANLVDGMKGTGLPQVTRHDYVTFEDGQKSVRCHHVVIQLTGERFFTYSPLTSL